MSLYRVEIWDSQLRKVAQVQNLVPFGTSEVLTYEQTLSGWGKAKFRIATKDPMFAKLGNIVAPYAYHVRIYRSNVLVWSGVVLNNPHRTHNYIEVEAVTYLFLLSKVLVQHDTTGDVNYRTFQSGTLAQAITAVINETKAAAPAGSLLANLTVGQIDNPVFPANFTDSNNVSLAGQPWTFSSTFQLKFDYRDVLYVIETLGVYAQFDFELVPSGSNLVFNFQSYIGTKHPELVFAYGATGQIEDYDVPLDGETMMNDITGVAADQSFNILKDTKIDPVSVNAYGHVQGVMAFQDAKNINALRARLSEQLIFSATPDAEVHVTLNDKAYPLGSYGLGDTVTINVQDHVIDSRTARRIVGIDVNVHGTGKENIVLITNIPRAGQ